MPRRSHTTCSRRSSAEAAVLNRVLNSLGVDAVQWRALARTYIAIDFRPTGGAIRQDGKARSGAAPLGGLLFISAIGGAAFAFIAAAAPDALVSASLLTTYAAANTMMMLLIDFTGIVVSPDDYAVLGPRPVGSRTYFAARLAAVSAYVGAISLSVAIFPAIVYGVRLGILAAPATILAVLLCDLSVAVLVITGYVGLMRWVHPSKLRR